MSGFVQLSETQEKSLVDRVDLKLVLAKDDRKFEETLNTFLPPLLLKLASPYQSVRSVVYESIKHVNSRVNANKDIKLPVLKLLDQLRKPSLNQGQDATNVITYSALFLSKGVERLNDEEAMKILPNLIQGISELPELASSRVFHIICKVLLTYKAPSKNMNKDKDNCALLNVAHNDLEFLLEKILKFFLLVPKRTDMLSGTASYSCPGLSISDVSFFIYSPAISFTKDVLNQYKRAIFDFLTSGLDIDDTELIPILIVISTQSIDISDNAITLLKRVAIPYEDENFICMLSNMFCGDNTRQLPPVNEKLQEKILGILERSAIVTKLPDLPTKISMLGINSDSVRVQLSTLSFIRHVCKFNEDAFKQSLDVDSTSIISSIQNNIKLNGWPKYNAPTTNHLSGIKLRASQYETVGELLKHDIKSVNDFKNIQFLLKSLEGDLSEFRSTIKDALGSLVCHFPLLPLEAKSELKKFLANVLVDNYKIFNGSADEKDALMSLRFVAIKFSNAAFDFEDVDARIFNILGTNQVNRFDVIQESFKGLNPYHFRMNKASLQSGYVSTDALLAKKITETKFPEFASMTERLLQEVRQTSEYSSIKSCIPTAVRLLQQTLISNSVYGKTTTIVQDENWAMRIEKCLEIDELVRNLVQKFISDISEKTIGSLCLFLQNEILHLNSISSKDDVVLTNLLLLLIEYCSPAAVDQCEGLLATALNHVTSNRIIANVYLDRFMNAIGILGARKGTKCPVVSQFLTSLTGYGSDAIHQGQQSLFLLYSHLIPRICLLESVHMEEEISFIAMTAIDSLKIGTMDRTCFKVLSQLLKFLVLNSLDSESRSKFLSEIKKCIEEKLKNDELAILLWGLLSMNSQQDDFNGFLDVYENLHSSKHIDFLFSAGEALTIILGGWNSKYLQMHLDIDVDISVLKEQTSTRNLSSGLKTILSFCSSANPSLQKASCIWLLCIVQYLGHLKEVSENFRSIHSAFRIFLAHRDEFVQESASRGLSIVYDMGDADMKEMMVKGLFKTLTNSNSALSLQSGSVSADTELFEPSILSTKDGSVSTYKDILNLANEVNDPGLVYKFMALAKNSSLWSSRKGVAFGLSAIMAKVSLQDLLINNKTLSKKLIPKLFRYRFDPSTTVANSMNNIWDTLFPDGAQALDQYFNDVLEELLLNSSNKEWRVREASSSALLYLVQTYPLANFEGKVEELWTVTFRLMDDIKDTVRTSGTQLARSLSKLLIKSLNSSQGKSDGNRSQKLLDVILPFLLGTKGLNSDAEEVRSFAIKTLLELIKESKESLKPYIPTLVFEMTVLLSVLEPQVINYLTLNADKFNVKSSEIDQHRVHGVSNSPIMQAIESLVDISEYNDKALSELVDVCVRASKKSVGLPSNVGASRVLQLVCVRHSILLKPYSGKLLKACYNGLENRNIAIASSYATAFGRIFKVSKLEKQVKYSKKIVDKYFETDSVDNQKIVGLTIESIYKYSAEDFDNVATILMPLIYIAKHGSEESVSSIFQDIWVESSKSGSSSLNLCFPEIIDLVNVHMKSNIFSIRKTCAVALCDACKVYSGVLNAKKIEKVFDILLEACSSRSWDGKEFVVSGVINSFKKFSVQASLDETVGNKIDKMLQIELSKKNRTYVKKLIQPFTEYVFFRNDEKLYEKLTHVIEEAFNELEIEDDKEDRDDSRGHSKKPKLVEDVHKSSSQENIDKENFKIGIIKSVAKELHEMVHKENGIKYEDVLRLVYSFMKGMFENSSIEYTWRSQLAYFETAITLISPLDANFLTSHNASDIFIDMWKYGYDFCKTKEIIESVKIKCIRYGGLLKAKLPDTNIMVNFDISELLRVDHSSVLKAEAVKIGISP